MNFCPTATLNVQQISVRPEYIHRPYTEFENLLFDKQRLILLLGSLLGSLATISRYFA